MEFEIIFQSETSGWGIDIWYTPPFGWMGDIGRWQAYTKEVVINSATNTYQTIWCIKFDTLQDFVTFYSENGLALLDGFTRPEGIHLLAIAVQQA